MATTTSPVDITRDETRGSWALWVGILTGPAAWTVQLVLDYMLEEFIACTPGARTPGEIWGMSVGTIAVIVNSLLVVATVGAGLLAYRCRRRIRSSSAAEPTGRAAWMALAGIMNSILFGLIIVVGFAPPLVLEVCRI